MLIIEVLLIIISVFWIFVGSTEYGIWAGQAPGGGLFPLIAGLIVLFCCTADIVMRIVKKQAINGPKYVGEDKCIMLGFVPRLLRPIVITAYGFLGLIMLKYLGFILCSLITCFVWLVAISRKPVLRSVLISIITTSFLYGVFVLWLKIPFPKGLF